MSTTVRIVSVSLITLLVAMACGAPIGVGGNFVGGDGPDDGGVLFPGAGGTGGSGGSGGTGGSAGTSAFVGVPCDVAVMLSTYCVSCHATGNASGLPPLVTRAELSAASPSGATFAARALARIQNGTMPPSGGPVPAADQTALQNWINGGLVDTTCNQALDAGSAVVTPVCTSGDMNRYWDEDMNVGLACKNCHVSQKPSRNYDYMGTVYPSLHEKNYCNANPPSTITIEILDANKNVVVSMTPSQSSGNFMSGNGMATLTLRGHQSVAPYTARVMDNGVKKAEMVTPQTDGDCNACHTVSGANGAPGRIIY